MPVSVSSLGAKEHPSSSVPSSSPLMIPHHHHDVDTTTNYSGAEGFLVGLSPSYWSHVPLCIAQVHQLQLVQGVHCLVVVHEEHSDHHKKINHHETGESNNKEEEEPSITSTTKLIPISRCRLVGCIVSVERKSSGATFYILDDGTGLLDCLAWEDDSTLMDALPPLTTTAGGIFDQQHHPQSASSSRNTRGSFLHEAEDLSSSTASEQRYPPRPYQVGDVVEVMGRVECAHNSSSHVVATNHNNTTSSQAAAATALNSRMVVAGGKQCLVFHCLRELHVTLIRDLSSLTRATPGCLDGESRHMMRYSSSSSSTERITANSRTSSSQQKQQPLLSSPSSLMLLQNGVDVLEWLGPDFATQVAAREQFPSVDDTVGAWRLFGSRCPCSSSQEDSSDLKTKLLYCHCIAKPLMDLDPQLVYRDALLRVLLQLEEKQHHHHNTKNNKNNDTPSSKTAPPLAPRHDPLFVPFQELATDVALTMLAEKQIKELGRPPCHAKQLLRQTVRALRDDGILYLYDYHHDIYLLLSCAAVLEPYIRIVTSKNNNTENWQDAMARTKLKKNMPAFLRKVPKARLQLVRRMLEEEEG